MTKILICGASSYLGHHLLGYLESSGLTVHAHLRPDSQIHYPGIASKARLHRATDLQASLSGLIAEISPDVVINLAAHAGRSLMGDDCTDQVIDANVGFTARLLAAMAEHSCSKLISIGSYWEMGERGDGRPKTLYAAAKRAQLPLLDYYAGTAGIRSLRLILSDIYGPTDWRKRLMTLMIEAALDGAPLDATGGEQAIDPIHVRDACAGIFGACNLLLAGSTPNNQQWALRGNERLSVKAIADKVSAVTGKALKVNWGAIPYPDGQIFEPESATPLLPNWRSEVTLDDGIKELADEARRPMPSVQ